MYHNRRLHSGAAVVAQCSHSLWTMSGERKRGKKQHTVRVHLCPKLTVSGLVLVGEVWNLPLWLGAGFRPLHSLSSEVKELCLLVGSSYTVSCNERSQQENKILFFQSSGSIASTALLRPPLKSPFSCG